MDDGIKAIWYDPDKEAKGVAHFEVGTIEDHGARGVTTLRDGPAATSSAT